MNIDNKFQFFYILFFYCLFSQLSFLITIIAIKQTN